jgi:Domain of unknown function (DUF4432)
LRSAAGTPGISVACNIQQLPVFSLWKNTDTPVQGYVTGWEPGTSFAYNRSYQRALNRMPTIGAKEQRNFDITYTLLADKIRRRRFTAKPFDILEKSQPKTGQNLVSYRACDDLRQPSTFSIIVVVSAPS